MEFLGVDVAGADGTWTCRLGEHNGQTRLVQPPARSTLVEIVKQAEAGRPLAVAIDAQLTWALSEERGWRSSDDELKSLLPARYRNWVASQNSLMAVPLRGRQLAECLSPIVGTIIETHPRASLYFAFPAMLDDIHAYKASDSKEALRRLWSAWTARFGPATEGFRPAASDALDALVCATVARLYHSAPQELRRLDQTAGDKRGRGPFFVIAPG